jgi:DNA-binding CsgD family transcriptional regulator
MALDRGDLELASADLSAAESDLDSLSPVASNDLRILRALQLACDYERGDAQGLIAFALSAQEDELFGEIWPSVAEPIISRSAAALSTHVSLAAARAYLSRWRLRELNSDRTYRVLAFEEIALLQRHRRNLEADELLTEAVATFPVRLDGGLDPHSALPIAEQIDLNLASIRSRLERQPMDAGAATVLRLLLELPQLTVRQRAESLLLSAFAAPDDAALHAALLSYFELLDERCLSGLANENRDRVKTLLHQPRLRRRRRHLADAPKLSRYLDAFDMALSQLPEGAASLTDQEMRVLSLLAEFTPNKLIAGRLGISVPTVRFHLKNLYRKLGAASRRQAVATAKKRGIISA